MPIYVDELQSYGQAPAAGAERHFGGGKRSCHMATDGSLDELHRFAQAIGLRRSWFQDGSTPHYDLTPSRRAAAVARGAVEVDTRELIARCKPKPLCSSATDLFIQPPPWSYDDNREGEEGMCNVYDATGELVAHFGNIEDNTGRDIGAGYLLAAAPELYDALAELVTIKDSPSDTYKPQRAAVAWEAARAALKKAKTWT